MLAVDSEVLLEQVFWITVWITPLLLITVSESVQAQLTFVLIWQSKKEETYISIQSTLTDGNT